MLNSLIDPPDTWDEIPLCPECGDLMEDTYLWTLDGGRVVCNRCAQVAFREGDSTVEAEVADTISSMVRRLEEVLG